MYRRRRRCDRQRPDCARSHDLCRCCGYFGAPQYRPTCTRLGGAAGTAAWSHPSRTIPFGPPIRVNLIATPRDALQAAASVVNAAGLPAYILSDDLEGESREVGRVHAAWHQALRPALVAPVRTFGVQSAVRYFERWRDHGHHQKASARRGLAKGRGGRPLSFAGLAQASMGALGFGGLRLIRTALMVLSTTQAPW